jgi:mRNA interferase MazF
MKDYKLWTMLKKEIHNSNLRPLGGKEKEVWICNLGENIGFEEDGKGNNFTRPVLILRTFNKNFCYIVPLSTTEKRGKYYYPFDSKTGKNSVALLSQSKSIDTMRLSRKVGYVHEEDFKEIKLKIKEILF